MSPRPDTWHRQQYNHMLPLLPLQVRPWDELAEDVKARVRKANDDAADFILNMARRLA